MAIKRRYNSPPGRVFDVNFLHLVRGATVDQLQGDLPGELTGRGLDTADDAVAEQPGEEGAAVATLQQRRLRFLLRGLCHGKVESLISCVVHLS